MKKAFLVTGLSNSLGRHEDELIRNDDVRKEIDEIVGKVFGEDAMGFNVPNDQNNEDIPSRAMTVPPISMVMIPAKKTQRLGSKTLDLKFLA